MLICEWIYHNFYKQVEFHREVFKFDDGGQVAMDWAFEMPQKTKYMSQLKKVEIIQTLFENESKHPRDFTAKMVSEDDKIRPMLVIFLGICSDETEIYI